MPPLLPSLVRLPVRPSVHVFSGGAIVKKSRFSFPNLCRAMSLLPDPLHPFSRACGLTFLITVNDAIAAYLRRWRRRRGSEDFFIGTTCDSSIRSFSLPSRSRRDGEERRGENPTYIESLRVMGHLAGDGQTRDVDGATGVRVRPSICGFAAATEGKKRQQCRGRLRPVAGRARRARERGKDL